MNQTTWIVGGGMLIVVLAAVLYVVSGASPTTTIAVNNDKNLASVASIDADIATATITSMPEEETTVSNETEQTKTGVTSNTSSMLTLSTSMGNITVKLYEADAPNTVANFKKLAGSGFYNDVKFHRVIKGFMVQAGDPNSKDDTLQSRWGTGGPGYKFDDEINPSSALYVRGYKHGVLAMANSGPNTNGSQFFIMAKDYPLPPLYTIFGEVVSGLDVVDAIDAVATDGNDRPLVPVVITSVK